MNDRPGSLTVSNKEATSSRFGPLIERRDGADFPYYNGVPVALSVWQWILVWVSVAVGFAALIFLPQPNNFVALIPRTLFVAIPLVVLALVTGRYWTAIFRKLRGVDFLVMIAFAVLNLIVTSILALIVKSIFGTNSNEVIAGVGRGGVLDTIAFYIGTGIQLVGEEVFTILPFLAIMYFIFAKAKLSRKTAIVLAWLISAVWFGAAHLPTYGWNVAQSFIIIGGARLVLSLAFIRTKNLWVSSGAHILNDWTLFTVSLIGTIMTH